MLRHSTSTCLAWAAAISGGTFVAHAGVAPVRVTAGLTGQAVVTASGGGADSQSFDAPVLVEEAAALADFTEQRTVTASLEIGGNLHAAQAWAQQHGGQTVEGGVHGGVFGYAFHTGAAGSDRMATASASQSFEFTVSGGAQRYRLHGFVGGLVEPGVPEGEKRRFGRVRLMGSGGVVHEFLGFSTQTGQGGVFDVSGVLEPGSYTVESVAQGRAQSGLTPNADPMITTVEWELEPLSACNDIDFNNDGLVPDIADVADMMSVFAGGECSTGDCDSVDFNNDGLFPDSTDLDVFLHVFGGGACE